MRVHGYLAFLVGICVTVWICLFVLQVQDRQIQSNFQRDADNIARDTSVRLQTYFDVLLSIKAMLAINDSVSRDQFGRYVRELNLARRYPGFQAIQFVRLVPALDLDAYAASVRADTSVSPDGYPQFAVHPPGAQGDHFVIEIIEPMKGNENAFGLDLAALPPHLTALETGRDSGAIVATGRVALVQDASGGPGFVARAALYHKGMPQQTVAERRAALSGFVAIVFRVDDLMREVIDAPMLTHLAVQISDSGGTGGGAGVGAGVATAAASLMYDSAARVQSGGRNAPLKRLASRASIDVGLRLWNMKFSGYDGSRYGRDYAVIALIGTAGIIESTLIAALMVAFKRRRVLANQLSAMLDEQRVLQDSAIVGIGLFAQGLILRCNRGLEEMMGYSTGELTGQPADTLRQRAALAQEDPFSCDEAGRRLHCEVQLVRRDGASIWCVINGQELDAADLSKGCVWVIHDISKRKQAEAALADAQHGLQHSLDELEQQKASVELAHSELSAVLVTLKQAQTNLITSEKMASLGSLVAGIAHELNTPIGNSLLTATALNDMVREFEKKFDDGGVKLSALKAHLDETKQACSIIAGSLARAADLITSFKRVAVDQASDQRRSFDLEDVLHDTLATFAAQLRLSNCEVLLAVAPGLMFESYPGSMGQVLSNLLNNALLHAFEGRSRGTVTIDAFEAGAGHVAMTFRDDGIGMSPRTLHRVFDPFFTTKMGQGGSGLGMNIVYNIVTGVLKGTLEVRSELEHGTTITLTIPKVAPDHSLDSAAGLLAPVV